MKLITMRQLSNKFGVDRSTIYRWIQQKKLPPPANRVNQTALWNEAAVEAAVRLHKLRVVASSW